MTIRLGSTLTADMRRQNIGIRKDALTTHAAVLGMTGSGKTGVLIGMVEELIAGGIPTVLVDIKGDMANIALQTDTDLRDKMAVRILTPGAFHGTPVNVFADLGNAHKVPQSVTALLKMIGADSDALRSKPHAFLSLLIEERIRDKQPCSLLDLIKAIQDPPFNQMGAMDLDDVFPKRSRTALAGKLNNLLVAPSFESWRAGVMLNLKRLTEPRRDGKTPVTIFSISHLVDDDEREFAVSLLMDELLSWTRGLTGTDELRAAVLIDECYGMMPPSPANPSTKKPMLTMLKQARAFGVGMILSTQNPMDIDYKGMANCQTWIIGRLQTANDRRRVVEGVCTAGSYDKKTLEKVVGGLQPREFLLARPKGTATFNSRTVSSQLQGPMSPEAIRNMRTLGLLTEDRI